MNYQQLMDEAQSVTELQMVSHIMLMDRENAQPRHRMATLASIYRDNYERLTLDEK